MKVNLAGIAAAIAAVAVAAQAAPRQEDFKVQLTGVAVVADGDDEAWNKMKPLPPKTRVTVPPGSLAVFFLKYDFPTNMESRLFLGPNFDESVLGEDPFGTSGSGLYSGKGKLQKVVILGAGGSEPYERPLLLKSVRVNGEIEAAEDAPRNSSFFICDAPVNVLFANSEKDAESAVTLEPRPAPKPDPTLGVVPQEVAKRMAKKTSSTPAGFTDNLGEALEKAKAEGKLAYVCFSGSDWCGWCKALESEVLSKDTFVSGVTNDFVLVFIDSPRNKKLLSEHAKAANKDLVKKYGIDGYPTALILDGDGNKVGETGYRQGGAEAYVKHLMKFRAK